MTASKTNPTLHEYLARGRPNLKRGAFSKRFGAFLEAHGLDDKVLKSQMYELFEIAHEHQQEISGLRAVDIPLLLQDYLDCEKLINETRESLKQLQISVKAGTGEGGFTASLARSLTFDLKAFENTLEDLFFDKASEMELEKSMLETIKVTRKTAQRELTHDLLTFIEIEFPNLDPKARNVLVGATMAGAGLFSEAILKKDAGPVESVPMKVTRANRHYQTYYVDPGVERTYPSAFRRKKKQDQEKKGKK